MPHERGNLRHKPTYYNFLAQHRHADPPSTPSLPPHPFNSPVGPPHSNQNWQDDVQLPLGNMEPMPPTSNLMITSGGCPIEEEIPPSWMEDTITLNEPIFNAISPIHPETAMHGCVIKEEIPPQWLEDSTKGIAPNVNESFNVATGIDLDYYVDEEESHMGLFKGALAYPASAAHDLSSEPEMFSPRRFSEEHLQLIFDMRREMVDQLQRQSTLNHHLDLLFDSLSNDPT